MEFPADWRHFRALKATITPELRRVGSPDKAHIALTWPRKSGLIQSDLADRSIGRREAYPLLAYRSPPPIRFRLCVAMGVLGGTKETGFGQVVCGCSLLHIAPFSWRDSLRLFRRPVHLRGPACAGVVPRLACIDSLCGKFAAAFTSCFRGPHVRGKVCSLPACAAVFAGALAPRRVTTRCVPVPSLSLAEPLL